MDGLLQIPNGGGLLSQKLGVKTALFFRPHNLTQKPHAVLRRVDPSDDSSDEGNEPSPFVHFKLFALKRFTMTPGKELLLTFEDDRLKDRAVLLCGNALTSDEVEMQERVKAVQEGDIPPLPKNALPPKMRRAWVKKPDGSVSVPVRVSTGIQAVPTTRSTDVQAQPILKAAAVQSNPISISASVQTTTSTSSVFVQTETAPRLVVNTSMKPNPESKDGSLSPMDLDSPETELTSSPLESSVSGSNSPSLGAPLSIPTPTETIVGVIHNDESPRSPNTISSQSIPVTDPSQSVEALRVRTPQSRTSSPSSHKSILPDSIPHNNSRALKEVSRKSSVYNPFVSAGFVTEFTGDDRANSQLAKEHVKNSQATDPIKCADVNARKKSPAEDPVENVGTIKTGPFSEEPQMCTNAFPIPTKVKQEESTNDSAILLETHIPSIDAGERETKSTHVPEPTTGSFQYKAVPTGPRNAVASSSKVTLDHTKSIPNAPRAPRSLRNQLDERPSNGNSSSVLSSGSYNNPLNIRPSMQMSTTSAPTGPKTLSGVPAKKRILIGIGTPMAKATSAASSLPPAPTNRSQSTPQLVAYTSPSPPPAPPCAPPVDYPEPPPPPPPIQIKWKRLSDVNTSTSSVDSNGMYCFTRILLIIPSAERFFQDRIFP
ncbi:hypothetical protein F5880DRAFT_236850 [Lentinula raphanica]|nr:hypothetical protein F5880DRAFT_236850 [Lentinula raphanica]